MNVHAIVAPELIRPTTDPVRIFQDVADYTGFNVKFSSEDVPDSALTVLPTLLNIKQEAAIKYALIGIYADKIWGDLLPAIGKEFRGINEVLRGMKRSNLPRTVVEKAINEALQGRDIEHDELAIALQRILAAWQLRHEVVNQQRPLQLWPPVFPDPDYEQEPHTFTPILQCLRKRFWKLGHDHDTYPDSPQIFKGHNWEKVLTEVFLIYPTWYRLDQESLFNQYFTIDIDKRHIYDPIWHDMLMNQGELHFGRVQLFTQFTSTVIRVVMDGMTFNINVFKMYPPDAIRAVIESSGGQPPAPEDPIDSYLKMLSWGSGLCRLIQEGNVYRVTYPKGLPMHLEPYARDIEVRWLDDYRATVTGDKSELEANLLTGPGRIALTSDLGTLGWLKWSSLGLTSEDTRRLISLWAMWTWQIANSS